MAELTAVRDTDGSWTFDLDAVTAAAASIPPQPPPEWFEPREFDRATPLTFTEDGQVYGHIADRSVPHIGLPGNIGAPKSRADYKWYKTGQVRCSDGSLVATGRITMDTSHADLQADASRAQDHYDRSGAAVADVVAYDDEWGVAVCGAARPGLTPEQMRMAMASPPSGDWRSVGGSGLELVACLLVSVPGFPVPRANLAASGAPMALVAAGVVMRTPEPTPTEESPVSQSDPNTPESLAAAAGFAEGEPTPDDGGSGFDSGDSVQIEGTDLVGQFVEQADDGTVVVQLAVPADLLSHADEDQAMAAAASFSDRMHNRARDRELADLKRLSAAQAEAIESLTSSAHKLLATERSREAERLIASAGIEA